MFFTIHCIPDKGDGMLISLCIWITVNLSEIIIFRIWYRIPLKKIINPGIRIPTIRTLCSHLIINSDTSSYSIYSPLWDKARIQVVPAFPQWPPYPDFYFRNAGDGEKLLFPISRVGQLSNAKASATMLGLYAGNTKTSDTANLLIFCEFLADFDVYV